jgi:hypothetical protein
MCNASMAARVYSLQGLAKMVWHGIVQNFCRAALLHVPRVHDNSRDDTCHMPHAA